MERDFIFPPPDSANPDGIVCMGGDLSPRMLLSAYRQGIFPWYGENEPILWFSPDPRFVVLPDTLHISETSKKLLRKKPFDLSIDMDFPSVIKNCATIPRPGQAGTWIVPDMVEAYCRLHELGYAHSIEAWKDGRLTGGLYGVSLGNAFFGESMFSQESGASRFAFLSFARLLFDEGFAFIDSQVHTDYVAGMGGICISRSQYLARLDEALGCPNRVGFWTDSFGKRLSCKPSPAYKNL
ncbi:MAG: leucyl/phenylalanyl-tRNA--protein transferase [Spirochaetaceae bacterium]|nr:leucyl/phenylalanyl-tRNA--protein transferase [Spirochaetaceae bacterium]